MSAVPRNLAIDAGALRSFGEDPTYDPGAAAGAPRVSSLGRHNFQRAAWLSPEILTLAVGALDFCLIPAAAVAATGVYLGVMEGKVPGSSRYLFTAFVAATLFVAMFNGFSGYRLAQLRRLQWQLTRILLAWGSTIFILLLTAFLTKTTDIYPGACILIWAMIALAVLVVGRCILGAAMTTRTGASYFTRNVVIVGAGDEGQRLIAKLLNAKDKSIVLCGVFDDRKSRLPASVHGFNVLGTTDDLLDFVRTTPVDEVIIALPLNAELRLTALCHKLKALTADLRISVDPLTEKFQCRGVAYVGVVPVLEVADRPLKNWLAILKWIEDKALAAVLLVLLTPLMAALAILIKLDSEGPVFFVQERFGFKNEVIRVLKFRTMHVDRGDPSGANRTVNNDPRVTRLGRWLRRQSIDELPQLINVLRGDMSLIGPRPHAIGMKAGGRPYGEAVEQYLHRHRVKPGITGWAQVNGLRGEVDTLEKAQARVAYDLYYIEHWSCWLDVKILLMTLSTLASRQNAY